jgi:hypothetical protein
MKIVSTLSLFLIILSLHSTAMQRSFEELVAEHPYISIATTAALGFGLGRLSCSVSNLTAQDIKNALKNSASAAYALVQRHPGKFGLAAGTIIGVSAVLVAKQKNDSTMPAFAPKQRSRPATYG